MEISATMNLTDYRKFSFFHILLDRKTMPTWRGITVIKYATDMILYSEMIHQNKPDFIIEAGTAYGGSASFFADMLNTLCGGGKVLTIDTRNRITKRHPDVEYLIGSSTDPKIVEKITNLTKKGSVMVVLDSDHSVDHVKSELSIYKDIVTPGQFMTVEDCYVRRERISGPGKAVNWFLPLNKSFTREHPEEKYLISVTREGWLRKLH
jgi:cephalosporin hydroxylase